MAGCGVFNVADLLAICPGLWICSFLDFLILLACPLSTLTSGLVVISVCPCIVISLVWIFVSSWLALVSGVAGFYLVYCCGLLSPYTMVFLHQYLSGMLHLIWKLSVLTSGLAVVLADPTFLRQWPLRSVD